MLAAVGVSAVYGLLKLSVRCCFSANGGTSKVWVGCVFGDCFRDKADFRSIEFAAKQQSVKVVFATMARESRA